MEENKIIEISKTDYPIAKYGDTGWRRKDYIYSNYQILKNWEKIENIETREFLKNNEIIIKDRSLGQIKNYFKKFGFISDDYKLTELGEKFIEDQNNYFGGINKQSYIILIQILNIRIKNNQDLNFSFLDFIEKLLIKNDYQKFKNLLCESIGYFVPLEKNISSFSQYWEELKDFVSGNNKEVKIYTNHLFKLYDSNNLTYENFKNNINLNLAGFRELKNLLFDKNKKLKIEYGNLSKLLNLQYKGRFENNLLKEYYDLTKRIFLSTDIFYYEKRDGKEIIKLKEFWFSFFKENLNNIKKFSKKHNLFLSKEELLKKLKIKKIDETLIKKYNFEEIFNLQYSKNTIGNLFNFLYSDKKFYEDSYLYGISKPLVLEFLISLILYSKLKHRNYKIEEITNLIFNNEYKPINTATGGKADIEVIEKNKNFVYTCELTLMVKQAQMYNEIEPTQRHLMKHKDYNRDLSFSIFTAKEFDRNFLNQLKDNKLLNDNDETEFLNIFPFSLESWNYIYEKVEDFNLVIDKINEFISNKQNLKNKNYNDWFDLINKEIQEIKP